MDIVIYNQNQQYFSSPDISHKTAMTAHPIHIFSDLLLCDYFDDWIKTYKEGNVRKVILQKYNCTSAILHKICPNLKIEEISKKDYQDIINTYAETHEKVTTLDFHHHLKSCIVDAIDEGIIKKNTTNKVVIKGNPPKEKNPKFLSQFETQLLMKSLELNDEMNLDYLIFLIIKTGLRFSETLGLTLNDFDFASQKISVNKTLEYKEGASNIRFAPTKNASSVREISIDWVTSHT